MCRLFVRLIYVVYTNNFDWESSYIKFDLMNSNWLNIVFSMVFKNAKLCHYKALSTKITLIWKQKEFCEKTVLSRVFPFLKNGQVSSFVTAVHLFANWEHSRGCLIFPWPSSYNSPASRIKYKMYHVKYRSVIHSQPFSVVSFMSLIMHKCVKLLIGNKQTFQTETETKQCANYGHHHPPFAKIVRFTNNFHNICSWTLNINSNLIQRIDYH